MSNDKYNDQSNSQSNDKYSQQDFKNTLESKNVDEDNSLTAPWDLNSTTFFNDMENNILIEDLTVKETLDALKLLNDKSLLQKFPIVERRYADEELPNQRIALISFVPSKGAKPDSKGIFGMAKVRGVFASEMEASQTAAKIIRYNDSHHVIKHAYVGRPFPITLESKFSRSIDNIDMEKEIKDTIESDMRTKREKDKKDAEDIKQRQDNLQSEVDREAIDKSEIYTTLRTKKAQLIWTYYQTINNLKKMKTNILNADKEIKEMDAEDKTHSEVFFKKFMEARASSGIDNSKIKDTFIKYMLEDVDLEKLFSGEEKIDSIYSSDNKIWSEKDSFNGATETGESNVEEER